MPLNFLKEVCYEKKLSSNVSDFTDNRSISGFVRFRRREWKD